jgi:hypothetical protein
LIPIINPYRFVVGGSWDLNEDFTGCGTNQCDGLWTSSVVANQQVDTTNNWIRWEVSRGTNNRMTYDLNALLGQDVSSTAWVFQCDLVWDTLGADNAGNQTYIGMWENDYSVGDGTASDSLFWFYNKWAGSEHSRSCIANAEAPDAAVGGDLPFSSTQNFPRTEDIPYYYQIIRETSTLAHWTVSKNSDFSTPQQDGSGSIPSTLGDVSNPLNYIGIGNENVGSTISPMRVNVTNFRFADGVTVAP